jgi:hypothetical protein
MKMYCAARKKEECVLGDLVKSSGIPLATIRNNASLSRKLWKNVTKVIWVTEILIQE